MESIWAKGCEIPPRPALAGDMTTEVAVVGAGMAGVLIADALQADGHEVTVLEAARIGSGQTQNTTAKITAQHGLCYQKLTESLGAEKAAQYARANAAAVEEFARIIAVRGIDCGWERKSAFVYGQSEERLRAEAKAAAALGLPAAFVQSVKLPFEVAGAVEFAGQAQFDPLRFLRAMAAGLTVYEQTPVRRADEHALYTEKGTVRAEKIVFACHAPFINFPGAYFARMHQERSYVIALEGAAEMDGMLIGAEENGFSFRNYGGLLLLGGGGHRTGENARGGRYALLRQKAREWFPQSREAARWSAQDCMTPDGAPYIGRYSAARPDWYLATGFGKWGMSGSMAAAMLLRGLLAGRQSQDAEVFDPGRRSARLLGGMAAEAGHSAKGLLKQIFYVPAQAAENIPAGQGATVRLNGRKAGVYRDEDGRLYAVETRCPHLGCQLEWNPDERSWDCPCHGSRFDRYGRLLSGPAQEDAGHA